MSLRATALSAGLGYQRLVQQAANTKTYLQQQRVEMVKPAVSANVVLATIHHLGQVAGIFAQLAAVPGIAAYARLQVADEGYDLVAEYQVMRDAIVNARDSLIGMFPKQAGTGFLLYQTLGADGSIAVRDFTAAQCAQAVTLIDLVIASID